jgi:hypothetical protein
MFCSLCTVFKGKSKESPQMISSCSEFLTITDLWLPLEREKDRS